MHFLNRLSNVSPRCSEPDVKDDLRAYKSSVVKLDLKELPMRNEAGSRVKHPPSLHATFRRTRMISQGSQRANLQSESHMTPSCFVGNYLE